eukprot:TRINITY_DN5903_c0_g1_i3.p1 TRINITY_DN5903_c0_g1~~TRINITY_DN5903_c0_g1_i3.p1  ORF type:complete len:443 (-),score=122.58 TRINITY_DN5903_c0_g1_i3:17-1345(-)
MYTPFLHRELVEEIAKYASSSDVLSLSMTNKKINKVVIGVYYKKRLNKLVVKAGDVKFWKGVQRNEHLLPLIKKMKVHALGLLKEEEEDQQEGGEQCWCSDCDYSRIYNTEMDTLEIFPTLIQIFPRMINLENLNWYGVGDKSILQSFLSIPLKSLKLAHDGFYSEIKFALMDDESFINLITPNLKKLVYRCENVRGERLFISKLSVCKQLEVLILPSETISPKFYDLHFPQLKRLVLFHSNNSYLDNFLKDFGAFSNNNNKIEHLQIMLMDLDVSEIHSWSLPNLKVLDVSDDQMLRCIIKEERWIPRGLNALTISIRSPLEDISMLTSLKTLWINIDDFNRVPTFLPSSLEKLSIQLLETSFSPNKLRRFIQKLSRPKALRKIEFQYTMDNTVENMEEIAREIPSIELFKFEGNEYQVERDPIKIVTINGAEDPSEDEWR